MMEMHYLADDETIRKAEEAFPVGSAVVTVRLRGRPKQLTVTGIDIRGNVVTKDRRGKIETYGTIVLKKI